MFHVLYVLLLWAKLPELNVMMMMMMMMIGLASYKIDMAHNVSRRRYN